MGKNRNYWGDGGQILGGCIPPSPPGFAALCEVRTNQPCICTCMACLYNVHCTVYNIHVHCTLHMYAVVHVPRKCILYSVSESILIACNTIARNFEAHGTSKMFSTLLCILYLNPCYTSYPSP